jgi:hypothetical protein
MEFSAFGESGGLEPRRLATIALVGLLLFSAVGGVLGSSSIAAAQQGGSNGNGTSATGTTNSSGGNGTDKVASQPVKTITRKFQRNGFDYNGLKTWRKEEIDKRLRFLWKNDKSVRIERGKTKFIIDTFDTARGVGDDVNSTEGRQIRQIIANVLNKEIAGVEPKTSGGRGGAGNASAGNGTAGNASVQMFVRNLKQEQVGYKKLRQTRKKEIKEYYRELATQNLSDSAENTKIRNIIQVLEKGVPDTKLSSKKEQKVRQLISSSLGESGRAPSKKGNVSNPPSLPDINIPSLIAKKLDSLADSFRKGAANILTNLYNLAFKTPVPENSGWKGVLGTPVDTKANQTFYTLFQKLLVDKLYPVTYSLLTVGIVFMAISMAGNPFMSHHQVVDYFIKLVLGIMYWAFAWTGVTLMHGVVNGITKWIRPSPEVMGALVTNVEALSAGATAAYFAGSGGILATLFSLGLELGMRRVLLLYVFPYIFPVLLLVLYLAPWRRLRGYASMAIWQYVNVLTMVIPIAVLLKGAAVVSLSLEGKSSVVSMLILVALFLVAATIPFISTYFFIQMPGTAKKSAKKGASGAWNRLGDAKDKMGWGGDGSASDSTATSGNSPGENADETVAAALDSRPGSSGSGSSPSTGQQASAESSGLSSSGKVDSTPDTTAGWVREWHEQESRDPMNDEAMLEAYFGEEQNRSGPHRTTMYGKLGD